MRGHTSIHEHKLRAHRDLDNKIHLNPSLKWIEESLASPLAIHDIAQTDCTLGAMS